VISIVAGQWSLHVSAGTIPGDATIRVTVLDNVGVSSEAECTVTINRELDLGCPPLFFALSHESRAVCFAGFAVDPAGQLSSC
jgi:hypothetical protein